MDPETALGLVKKGATVLLLNVPQHTIIGIDTQVLSVGPSFKGIKMIPPGPHFVYYSSSDKTGNRFSPVTGFFISADNSMVFVRIWDEQQERLVNLSEDEADRYLIAVEKLEFDSQLGPYQLNSWSEWKHISTHLSKEVIERIEPIGGEISIIHEATLLEIEPKTVAESRSCKQRCYFTSVPRVIKHRGIKTEELTSFNLDKTQLLESLLLKDYGGREDLLLGELEFTFISFLLGQSLEAFFQWKALVSLLLSCTDAPFRTRSQLFMKFIEVLYFQVKVGFCERDKSNNMESRTAVLVDDSWLSGNNFLHHLCKDFFSIIEEASVVDGDLLTWTRKLKELLVKSLGWEFSDDGLIATGDDEYAPVVEILEETTNEET